MKPGLSLRVSQHLALTPQLQQSIRLLQLSTLELSQEVEQLLDENPFLEKLDEHDDMADREHFGLLQQDSPVEHDDEPLQETGSPSDTLDWDGDGTHEITPDDSEWGVEARAHHHDEQDQTPALHLAGSTDTLSTHLLGQAARLRLSAEDGAALRFLIESLNDDGYLEDPLEDLVASLQPQDPMQAEALLVHFGIALRHLHQMEPCGVGARDLAECLRLQLQERPDNDITRSALRLCALPLDMLARRDTRKLAAAAGVSEDHVREAMRLIASLEPKPARRFAQVQRHYIVPDVIVSRSGSGPRLKLQVHINPDVMPRLKVNDIYANALRGRKSDSHAGLQQRLTEARWFIKNIKQRFDTILRVSRAIVERQRNFFVHGELAMRPLVLREIADELGLHESTISRVTTAKYMATPFGTFELKYFFGSSLGTQTGGNASSTAVRALIKQFIASEDGKKPLSDNAIADLLKEQGIDCARRTVAKYREGLKIPTASLRKAGH
jgi:RNA polymerase sigma-54 factor